MARSRQRERARDFFAISVLAAAVAMAVLAVLFPAKREAALRLANGEVLESERYLGGTADLYFLAAESGRAVAVHRERADCIVRGDGARERLETECPAPVQDQADQPFMITAVQGAASDPLASVLQCVVEPTAKRVSSDPFVLDASAQPSSNLDRWFEEHEADLEEIWNADVVNVVGFADTVGKSSYNLELSSKRARFVADQLQARNRLGEHARLRVFGLGETLRYRDTVADALLASESGEDSRPIGNSSQRRVWIVPCSASGPEDAPSTRRASTGTDEPPPIG